MRIRFAGFGGQGVVLCGFMFGKAAMLDGRNSIQTQSYGSASRGGLTKSDVTIADGDIHDLICEELDILVAMSQQSYAEYKGDLLPDGKLFYESDLVALEESTSVETFGAGVTDLAFKQFGRKIVANVIMLGFVNRTAQVVSRVSLAQTIRDNVPPGTEEKNVQAFKVGERMAAER